MRACAACLRRGELLAELSPRIDRRFSGRRIPGLLAMDDEELVHRLGRDGGSPRPDALDADDRVLRERAALALQTFGTDAICRHDPEFPARLLTISDPPSLLYVQGPSARLVQAVGAGHPAVAIVGSRRASEEALQIAEGLALDLAAAGVTVVSGMAFGIDAAAHEGALAAGPAAPVPANSGAVTDGPARTVAVLGGGPEQASPARLAGLYRRLVHDGVVISELPPGTRPRRWTFPARNRIIAGLVDLVVVVAAAERSGSLITADLARGEEGEEGRLAVVPGSTLDPRCAGSNALLREPDVVPVLDAGDVLARLESGCDGGAPPLEAFVRDPLAGLEGDARALAAALGSGPRSLESILVELDADRVLRGLGELEAAGRLRRGPDGALVLRVGAGR